MTAAPEQYQDVPEADRKKAKIFFDRGAAVAATGNYDFAIEMYTSGLGIDPENLDAHKALRDTSLKRKASGGKAMGMIQKMRLPKPKDEKQALAASEKLLAFDPGSTDQMAAVLKAAQAGGFFDTVMWIAGELSRALRTAAKPDFAKWVQLKDAYRQIGQFKLATDAAGEALQLRPDDQELHHEVKQLAAEETMRAGKYGGGGNFRDSMKDRAGQDLLLDKDKDVRTEDAMSRLLQQAEAALAADPEEAGKVAKLVDLLVKTETPENERRATDLLGDLYERTGQFRFRFRQTEILIAQLDREDRAMRAKVAKNAGNEEVRDEYRQFRKSRAERELAEFQLAAENYPTDATLKFRVAQRLFLLERHDEAIPMLQQAVGDPKNRTAATILLGQSFLAAGFGDEAVDTLKGLIDQYQIKGDDKSREMYYWYARSLEQQGDVPTSIRTYSQVAQWDFNYRDVQARIKRLRAGVASPAAGV